MLAALLLTATFEVNGLKFGLFDYFVPCMTFMAAGLADNTSTYGWYADLATGEDPMVGLGPGPGTEMFYGWREVQENLASWGPMIEYEMMNRGNELGITLLNDLMFPETGTISLGLPNEDHAFVRPYLGNSLDKAEDPASECDGSACWNAAWLSKVWREIFASVDEFSTQDIAAMVTSILHKVQLNVELNREEAEDFTSFQKLYLLPQVLPPAWAHTFVRPLVAATGVLKTKEDLVAKYSARIREKWPSGAWDPRRLEMLAATFVDSLALAGGLSVPSALQHAVTILLMEDSPAGALDASQLAEDEGLIIDFVYEVVRRFPPVAGVPRWVMRTGNDVWYHEIPNVGQAMSDPEVFPMPHDFIVGRPGLNSRNSSLSMSWADSALVDGNVSHPNSHACPGRALSMRLMTAFLQEFLRAGPWEMDDAASATLTMYKASTHVVRKVPTG